MPHIRRCAAFIGLLLILGTGVVLAWPTAPALRTVMLIGAVTDADLLALSVAHTASGLDGPLLLEPARPAASLKPFLTQYEPARVITVGAINVATERVLIQRQLNAPPRTVPAVLGGAARALVAQAEQIVLCSATPPEPLLHAACWAATLRVPLVIATGAADEADQWAPLLQTWGTQRVWAIGTAGAGWPMPVPCTRVADPATAQRTALLKAGPIRTLVLANAHDRGPGLGGMSVLAPWLAAQKRAALLLTNEDGTDGTALLRTALATPALATADALIVAANLRAIPMERRPNPVPGKDAHIEMEPLTPTDDEPATLATGRLFHADRALVPLQLARAALPAPDRPRSALVASNPGGSLPMLETVSRHTAEELRNTGYRVTARFNRDLVPSELRRQLPRHDVFLWEGHYRTLVDNYGFNQWDEPLPNPFVFLQSCLALNEEVTGPLIERGAVALVGSSTRIYSATGGAFSLAYFDALNYDRATLGGALRQAKNFLYCYARLKRQRLGEQAALAGANLRSAWAFSLWGDPTYTLPAPQPTERLPAVRCEVEGRAITLHIPPTAYDKVAVEQYTAELWPNARLAGLLTRDAEFDKKLIPFLFAEVALKNWPADRVPQLRSPLPTNAWVFNWDARRQVGYLLVLPRAKDRQAKSVRFTVG